MKVALLLFVLFYCALSYQTIVELLVFSGVENPKWGLNADQSLAVAKYIQTHGLLDKIDSHQVLGYTGFRLILSDESNVMHGFVANDKEFEEYLLNTMKENIPDLIHKEVAEHVESTISNSAVFDASAPRNAGTPFFAAISNIYVRGPDNVTAFDPSKWNDSPQVQYNNNCYNYGNDIRTDTFAQPGRGTGHKWTSNTCEDVTAAAERDGLISLDHVPETNEQPKIGHFVALVMWPNVNFHWYKKDISTNWSHKPGSTPARDTDNSGKIIPDPRYANRGPYTIFCGFMISVPSNVTIN